MDIPHNKPSLGEEEIEAIKNVIDSGWIVQGERIEEFENLLSEFLEFPSGHAAAVSNGTSALYLALKILDVEQGDEIIIPTYVCSAVLNAIYMANAIPVIVDVNSTDFNISYSEIIKNITDDTQAIIVPHIFGVPAEINKINQLDIPLIEDCAQALGTKIDNQYVGTFGDISVFSFYASKMITTAQGGMLVSKNKRYIKKAKDYLNFDYRKEYYPRFNFQMTDIQAAMGIVQLNKLNGFLKNRRLIAKEYKDICRKIGLDYQKPINDNRTHNSYRFVIKGRKKYLNKLKIKFEKAGIETIIPIKNWELLHNYLNIQSEKFHVAEKISKSTLSLPIFPEILQNKMLEEIKAILRKGV